MNQKKELIVPWLNVMAACVALLFTFIIGMLLNCLRYFEKKMKGISSVFRKIINGDYLPEDEHINDIQSEFLLENTFVTEPGSRSISTRRTTYPCLLE